ncbi:hypothetical protein COY07_04880, partial [Candidatus Peregrinibacteria bacterium CG_4_10_14_0_2_um_filter_43_11]
AKELWINNLIKGRMRLGWPPLNLDRLTGIVEQHFLGHDLTEGRMQLFFRVITESGEIKSIPVTQSNLVVATRAAFALPVLCPEVNYEGEVCYDGMIGETLPLQLIQDARDETRRLLLIHHSLLEKRDLKSESWLYRFILKRRPKLLVVFQQSIEDHNAAIDLIRRLDGDGQLYVISPDATGVPTSRTLERSKKRLDADFELGEGVGRRHHINVSRFLKGESPTILSG